MSKSETVHVRLRPAQRKLLDAAVAMSGFDSRSEALRALLVDWSRTLFRQQLQAAIGAGEDGDQLEFEAELEKAADAVEKVRT